MIWWLVLPWKVEQELFMFIQPIQPWMGDSPPPLTDTVFKISPLLLLILS